MTSVVLGDKRMGKNKVPRPDMNLELLMFEMLVTLDCSSMKNDQSLNPNLRHILLYITLQICDA